jgi:hypothetical protein
MSLEGMISAEDNITYAKGGRYFPFIMPLGHNLMAMKQIVMILYPHFTYASSCACIGE